MRAAAALLGVLLIAADPSGIARIHGQVVAIDAKRGTFQIRHDPFKQMPMVMTMEVKPKSRADLGKLHVGETIDVTVDTAVVPWPGSDIRPAKR
jgi:Cu/Ag efflux protein CusF